MVIEKLSLISNVLYFGDSWGSFFAINATTGASLWHYGTSFGCYTAAAVVDGLAIFGCDFSLIVAVNAVTGVVAWTSTIGIGTWRSTPTIYNNHIYIGSGSGFHAKNGAKSVLCLNTSGSVVWEFTAGSFVLSNPLIYNGLVYFGSNDNNVYAVDATTGVKKWSFSTKAPIYSSALALDGVIAIGGTDGSVYFLDWFTGSLVGSFATGGSIVSQLTLVGSTLYVPSGTTLYALRISF